MGLTSSMELSDPEAARQNAIAWMLVPPASLSSRTTSTRVMCGFAASIQSSMERSALSP